MNVKGYQYENWKEAQILPQVKADKSLWVSRSGFNFSESL